MQSRIFGQREKNVTPPDGVDHLDKMLTQNSRVFWIRLGPDLPVCVSPPVLTPIVSDPLIAAMYQRRRVSYQAPSTSSSLSGRSTRACRRIGLIQHSLWTNREPKNPVFRWTFELRIPKPSRFNRLCRAWNPPCNPLRVVHALQRSIWPMPTGNSLYRIFCGHALYPDSNGCLFFQ